MHRTALTERPCTDFGRFDTRSHAQPSGCLAALRARERAGRIVFPAGLTAGEAAPGPRARSAGADRSLMDGTNSGASAPPRLGNHGAGGLARAGGAGASAGRARSGGSRAAVSRGLGARPAGRGGICVVCTAAGGAESLDCPGPLAAPVASAPGDRALADSDPAWNRVPQPGVAAPECPRIVGVFA